MHDKTYVVFSKAHAERLFAADRPHLLSPIFEMLEVGGGAAIVRLLAPRGNARNGRYQVERIDNAEDLAGVAAVANSAALPGV